jgi:UPF0755 protein
MRWLVRLLALAGIVLLLAAGGLYLALRSASEPFQGYSGEEVFFTVTPGQPSASIARALEAAGIIRDQRFFRAALAYRRVEERLQAGEYRFAGPLSTLEVVDRLVRGDVYSFPVTVPEGLTVLETANLLAAKGLGDAAGLRQAFENAALVAELDPDASDLEGYLFPETYRFTREPAPGDVARQMVSRFLQKFDGTRRSQAAALKLSVRQVVVLASIVEKETGQPDERPLIASVFLNRLARGMLLQSDPTLIYDLKRQGRFDGNLKRSHLEMDSVYNTYRQPGLPPGPIASPGLAAIDAVLAPEPSNYLYFVARNDGTHHFSATFAEHSAAVRRYQIEYFRQRRRAQKGPGPS